MTKIQNFKTPPPTCHIFISTLFLPQRETTLLRERPVETIPSVTTDELIDTYNRFEDNKLLDPDGIPNRALKARLELIVNVSSSCLRGVIPKQWKRQRLVLLPKVNKPPHDILAHRPLCMLDTMVKVLDWVICNRLKAATDKTGDLAEHQYGFEKKHLTVDAVRTVTTIAQNAIEEKIWKGGNKKYCVVLT